MTKDDILSALPVIASFGLILYGVCSFTSEEATRLSEADLANTEEIQKQLDVTRQEAEELKAQIADLKNTPPAVSYYVAAPTVSAAAEKVQESISNGTAPEEVLAPSDKTVIAEGEQKVDVYKINLRNNHKIKAGMSVVDDKAYLSVGYQAGRVEGILHFDGDGLNGASVLYTIKEW